MNVRLKKEQKIKVSKADDLYPIVQNILLRENKYSRNREHFWVVGLDPDNTILYIELVTIGTMTLTLIDPKEVFRVGVLKLATYLILIHNHPFGSLEPSDDDIKVTNELIHGADMVRLEVLDHLIINPNDYYSFVNDGIFEVLKNSDQYLPNYLRAEEFRKEIELENKISIAKRLLLTELKIDDIVKATKLPKEEVVNLKKQMNTS